MFNAQFGGQISWLLPAALDPARRRSRVHRDAAAHRPHARRARCSGAAGCSSPALAFSLGQGHHPRVLLGRARAGDRRARRHRRRDVLGAPRQPVGPRVARRSSIAVTAVWAYVLLTARRLAPDVAHASCSSAGSSAAASLRSRRCCAAGCGVASRSRAVRHRARRARGVHAVDGRAPAQRCDPDRRSGRAAGGPGGGFRRRRSAAPAAAARTPAGRVRASGRRLRPVPGGGTANGALPTFGGGTGRGRRRRRRRRAAQRSTPSADDHDAVRTEHRLPLDRGGDRRQQRGRVPARLGQGDHGDRRLQRHRSHADARGVRSRETGRVRLLRRVPGYAV